MVDLPGRSAFEPDDRAEPPEDTEAAAEGSGWGSPVPAEYGSLHALRPPAQNREPGPLTHGLFSDWSRGAPRRAVEGGEAPTGKPVAPADQPAEVSGPGSAPAAAPADPAGEQAPTPSPASPDRAFGLGGLGVSARGAGPSAPDTPAAPVTDGYPVTGQVPITGDDPAVQDPVRPARDQLAGQRSGPDRPGAEVPGPGPAGPAGSLPPMPVFPPRPGVAGRPGRRPGRARSRVAVRHLDVGSVAKMSVLFYLVVLVVIVVAAVLLWVAADVFGTLPSIEKSVRTLFSLRKFRLHPGAVALYTAAAGAVIAMVGTLANILLSLIYNLIADVVGGIRVELESFSRD